MQVNVCEENYFGRLEASHEEQDGRQLTLTPLSPINHCITQPDLNELKY